MAIDKLRILVVGLGNMGRSHALAYHRLHGFEIVGLMSRTIRARAHLLPAALHGYPLFEDYEQALRQTQPDAVSINTYTDSHAAYAIAAMDAGCHVFLEKPLAANLADAEAVVAKARATRRKLVLGYILRVHPAWQKLIELGRGLGKPLVMRMNLNQQSSGPAWVWHKNLMRSLTPIVDCGVHYVDVMCQLTRARPTHVHGIGARLAAETGVQNYGRYSNPEFDKLMTDQGLTKDQAARMAMMKDSEEIAMGQNAWLPIYYYVSKALVSQKLEGYVDNAKHTHRARWMSIKEG